jgi:UDP-2,3-diacylglucosamine pyrophosphatase LpxH
MLTDHRLSEAYLKAKVYPFDQSSKYIIFSDWHRGDDSISDEFTRNQTLSVAALSYYNDKGYVFIEAGDGDELWEYKEFNHIRAAHTDVFTVMKKFYEDDRLIMIYGNHNIRLRDPRYVEKNYFYFYDEYQDKCIPLFKGIQPVESVVLKSRVNGQKIFIVHGNQGDFLNDQWWFLTMLSLRYFWRFMHLVGFKNPASPAKNQMKRHFVEKKYDRWLQRHPVMLICGHTHRMKFSKPGKLPYFNSGCGINTKGITGIEIVDGCIMLVQWRVQANQDGLLETKRRVIRGPEPIVNYHRR